MNLWMALMGTDCVVLNIAYFTENRKSGADTNAADCINARSIIASELDDKEKFNAGLFKEFTGDSKLKTRTLYEAKNRTFYPAKLMFTVNDMPDFKKYDGALQRRICIIPFTELFKYKHQIDPSNTHHHERDDALGKWLTTSEARRAFFDVLMDHMPKYLTEGLNRTANMTAMESDYSQEMDEVGNWLTECLERSENRTDVLMLSTVGRAFNELTEKRYSPKDFCSRVRLSSRWKEHLQMCHKTACFKGWRMKPMERGGMIEDAE
jgi:phage/plasmid-associated DNA primase